MNRRNLRNSAADDQSVDRTAAVIEEIERSHDKNENRELYTVRECANLCGSQAAGQCRVFGCGWYNANRRQLQYYGKGYLSNSTICQITADSVTSDLNYLVSQSMVSSSCINLLNAPRQIKCYEDVMFGIVEAFNVIDADTDTVLIPFLPVRQSICGSKTLNIEVTVNACVDSVNITLFNVNKRVGFRTTAILNTTVPGPYTLFGMNGTGDFNGQRLPFGNYTLFATPDGNYNKTRTRGFFINPSC